jgi:signal transduction histidine kinase
MLAGLLRRHRDAITSAWAARLRELPHGRYAASDPADLRQWSASAIDALLRSREHGSTALLEAHAREMALDREAQGFEVDEVIEGLLLLNETVLPYVLAAGVSQEDAAAATLALGADMRSMAAQFARRFAESKRRTVEQVAALEERQRLARDLHDSVSQSLYGLGMCAEAAARRLEAGDVAGAIGHLRDVRDSAGEALREMRFLIFELRPSILQDEGLVEALRARLSAVEGRVGMRVELDSQLAGRLPAAVEEALYGIAREALNNSLRHAHATRVVITVRPVPDGVALEVADNGVGFEPAADEARGGLGIDGMRERARRVAGSIDVASRPRQGTVVRVRVPLGTVPGHPGAEAPQAS